MTLTRKQEELDLQIDRELTKRDVGQSFEKFVTNFVWIEDKVNNTAIPFKLWPSQVEILPDFLTALLLVILKARQLGLTWLCAAYATWLVIFKPLELIVVISAKGDWAVEFMDRVYFIIQRLPAWMVPKITKQTTEVLRVQHAKGYSEIKSLATTPEGAQSKTPTLLILDETARNLYIRQIWAASKPGIDAAQGRIIVISNAIKDGVGWAWTRDMFKNAMLGLNNFKHIFMPWQARPDRPADFKTKQLRDGMDEDDFSQHYPESAREAISALLGSYFGKTLARHEHTTRGTKGRLSKTKKGELVFEEDKKGILEIWRFPVQLTQDIEEQPWVNRYCMGSDVSEGLGQSYSVAYVYDRLLNEFVARLRSNRVDAYAWAKMLFNLSKYYESHMDHKHKQNALICVETTGAGQTTVKKLKDTVGSNLYVQVVPESTGHGVTKRYGWHESNQAKHELSGDLKEFYKITTGTIYCEHLLSESETWIRHENGKIGPEESKLGDCVIGAGCTIQADMFIGLPPVQLEPLLTGWRKEIADGEKSAWVT